MDLASQKMYLKAEGPPNDDLVEPEVRCEDLLPLVDAGDGDGCVAEGSLRVPDGAAVRDAAVAEQRGQRVEAAHAEGDVVPDLVAVDLQDADGSHDLVLGELVRADRLYEGDNFLLAVRPVLGPTSKHSKD